MPLSFSLYYFRNFTLVSLIQGYLATFRPVRHDDICRMIELPGIKFARCLVERNLNPICGLADKLSLAKKHFVPGGRCAFIARQR
ncbi:MAG: hypothetical protein ACLP4V_17680 [Methylocella sp.]